MPMFEGRAKNIQNTNHECEEFYKPHMSRDAVGKLPASIEAEVETLPEQNPGSLCLYCPPSQNKTPDHFVYTVLPVKTLCR